MIVTIALVSLVCALIPAAMMIANLRLYVVPPQVDVELPAVSVLIPARDEAAGIGAAIRAALATRGVEFEVVVIDDGSSDRTAAIVEELAANDARVRLERAPALPGGWNGKQHACWALAQVARYPVLCFVDADVRLGPECVSRMAGFLQGNALVSGFPRQITRTWMERMLLPLIHFVLLGFLPISRMRKGTEPAYAAGCGQFLMARRDEYFQCGGHSGIRLTMHDGLRLPRLFRKAGFRTDLADLTELATCRMYRSASEVWSGLAKNATEGIADPKRIVPVTLVLLMGQVVPFAFSAAVIFSAMSQLRVLAFWQMRHMFIFGITATGFIIFGSMTIAVLFAWLPRLLAVRRFKQDWRSALLHPLGILLLLVVQWYALARKLGGGKVGWRGRVYGSGDESSQVERVGL
jgi:glycosyltransferase involved in cell wall biosynthesis